MFNTYVPTKAFSFSKILNGISKTLNVANQLIPLYNQARPLITNARNILGVLKDFNEPKESVSKHTIDTQDYEIKKDSTTESSDYNSPTFFI